MANFSGHLESSWFWGVAAGQFPLLGRRGRPAKAGIASFPVDGGFGASAACLWWCERCGYARTSVGLQADCITWASYTRYCLDRVSMRWPEPFEPETACHQVRQTWAGQVWFGFFLPVWTSSLNTCLFGLCWRTSLASGIEKLVMMTAVLWRLCGLAWTSFPHPKHVSFFAHCTFFPLYPKIPQDILSNPKH